MNEFVTKTAEKQNGQEVQEVQKVQVTYMLYMASLKCDCGKEMMLSQNIYNDPTYRGGCVCGEKYHLRNNKLKCIKE